MQPRNCTKEDFFRISINESTRYGINIKLAKQIAEREWDIRQELIKDNYKYKITKKASVNTSNFGHEPFVLMPKKPKTKISKLRQRIVFNIDKELYKELLNKNIWTKSDITSIVSNDSNKDFFKEISEAKLAFPNFSARLNGYQSWKMIDWFKPYIKNKKIVINKLCS